MKTVLGVLVSLAVFGGLACAEELTLSTYYPAPSGSYMSFRSHKMCIGSTCTTASIAAKDILAVLGNLGIGSTTPGYAIQVGAGNAVLGMPLTGQDVLIKGNLEVDGTIFNNVTTSLAKGLDKQVQYNDGGSSLAGATDFVFDKVTGNVGIGVAVPAKKLDVGGDALINGLTVGRGAGDVPSNAALGEYVLKFNTTGTSNSAIGMYALHFNKTGASNSAVGVLALYSNTTGSRNAAVGTFTLYSNTTGSQNTAMGSQALYSNSVGISNAALGALSLHHNTTGNNNTAVGDAALLSNTTGSNNVVVGYNSGGDAVISLTTQSNYAVFGNTDTANANIKVAWVVTSDARDKTGLAEVLHGLDFVSKLKPVQYEYKTSREDDTPIKDGKVRYGFLAQDILSLEGEHPVVIDNRDDQNLKFDEASLIPILVRAIQEQQEEIKSLKAKFDDLKYSFLSSPKLKRKEKTIKK